MLKFNSPQDAVFPLILEAACQDTLEKIATKDTGNLDTLLSVYTAANAKKGIQMLIDEQANTAAVNEPNAYLQLVAHQVLSSYSETHNANVEEAGTLEFDNYDIGEIKFPDLEHTFFEDTEFLSLASKHKSKKATADSLGVIETDESPEENSMDPSDQLYREGKGYPFVKDMEAFGAGGGAALEADTEFEDLDDMSHIMEEDEQDDYDNDHYGDDDEENWGYGFEEDDDDY